MVQTREISVRLQVTLYIAIGIVSLLFNLLIIFVILSRKKMRTTNNFLLVNLAVSDVGIIIVGIPPTVVNLLSREVQTTGALCQFAGILILTSFIGSNFNLILIAVHRYFLITRSRHYDKMFSTPSKMFSAIFILRIAGFVIGCPPLFGWGRFAYDFGRAHCMVEWSYSVSYLIFLQTTTYVIPLLVLIYCYYKVTKITRSSQKRLKASADRHNLARQLREHKLTIMLITVVICFMVCFMPYAALIQTEGLFKIKSSQIHSLVAILLAYSNSLFDFWIYSAMSTNFRKALISLWHCLFKDNNKIHPVVVLPGATSSAGREEDRIKISADAELSERRSYIRRSRADKHGTVRNFYEEDDDVARQNIFVIRCAQKPQIIHFT